MDVIVGLEGRFLRTPDGHYWTPWAFNYAFWGDYLSVFDRVKVLARVKDVNFIPENMQRVDGEKVIVLPVKYYHGPIQFFLRRKSVTASINQALASKSTAAILRAPGVISWIAGRSLIKNKRPFALEVVGDPYDVFSPGAINHPLRFYFRWLFTRRLKKLCMHSCAVSYVTKKTLQKRYPCKKNTYTCSSSYVRLTNEDFVTEPWIKPHSDRYFTLLSIGSLETEYKGIDVAINAVKECLTRKLNLKYIIVGDGKVKRSLECQVKDCGLTDHVSFIGQVAPGKEVQSYLDCADIFIIPSRTEGLPRVLIEAMARGLPCIGSDVGGIPELLKQEYLVPAGDVLKLADKIANLLEHPEDMAKAASDNLTLAKEFHLDKLMKIRKEFYFQVAKKAEE